MDEVEKIKKEKVKEFMEKSRYPEKPLNVSDNNFKDYVSRYPIAVVDVYADWCMPCKAIAPIIDSLAKKYRGKAVFLKLNVDENPITATEFGVMSIPTLLVFKDGKLVDRLIGALPANVIEDRIKKFI